MAESFCQQTSLQTHTDHSAQETDGSCVGITKEELRHYMLHA
jgi:hypothetical protein